MQQWEYKIFHGFYPTSVDPDFLNQLGDEGWELVSVIYGHLTCTAYLKRPKTPTLRMNKGPVIPTDRIEEMQ